MSIGPADNGVMLNKKGNKMKFFDNYKDYFDYFFFKYSSERKIRKLDNAWHGAGYYWIDSTNNINYSIADTRLENVPFSTVPKCEVCNALGEICPACSDEDLTLINI